MPTDDTSGELLSVTTATAETYTRDARRDEKVEQKAAAWDAWLDCLSIREIETRIGVDQATVDRWVSQNRKASENETPPASRQHFDVWSFGADGTTSGHFGKMPPAVVESLLTATVEAAS